MKTDQEILNEIKVKLYTIDAIKKEAQKNQAAIDKERIELGMLYWFLKQEDK